MDENGVMKLPALLFSDTHFTSSPRDDYRWGLWDWLRDACRAQEVRTLVHLGDMTDAKDYHASSLVNRIVDEVVKTSACVEDFYINLGNHDSLRRGHAFFSFLSHLPGVRFVTEPTELPDDGKGPAAFMLPHTKDPARDWAGLDLTHYDLLFMHQTVQGARSSNGQVMRGEPLPWLQARKVWGGDIHVPQVVGGVEYVGSPYPVHFGDDFEPRCVLLDRRGRPSDLRFETIRRLSLRFLPGDDSALQHVRRGDQVKAVVELAAHERHEWRRVQGEVMSMLNGMGADVVELRLAQAERKAPMEALDRPVAALTDEEAMLAFVEANGLGVDAYEAGLGTMR